MTADQDHHGVGILLGAQRRQIQPGPGRHANVGYDQIRPEPFQGGNRVLGALVFPCDFKAITVEMKSFPHVSQRPYVIIDQYHSPHGMPSQNLKRIPVINSSPESDNPSFVRPTDRINCQSAKAAFRSSTTGCQIPALSSIYFCHSASTSIPLLTISRATSSGSFRE